MATTAASLLNTPRDQQEFDIWAFSLNQNVLDCQQAIQQQTGERLPVYQLYPVPTVAIGEWLQRVGQALDAICAAAGVQAFDVENVDLEDERARQAWIWTIFNEVQSVRAALRI